jgi:damage-control phosphatase, subfamily I
MRTYLDCIPCFFRQALDAARISGAGTIIQRIVLHEVAKTLPEISLRASPPEIAGIVYGIVRRATQHNDPYRKIKKQSNTLALMMYPELRSRVSASDDRLLKAVELSIAGNIIDYGVKNSLNIKEELKKIMLTENHVFGKGNNVFIHYHDFKRIVRKAKNILYLADNAGETVFDRILIEEIKKRDAHKKIIYAVKGLPIINDALIGDAYRCGIDKIATVVSSGSSAPGTILSLCSREFLKIYRAADMIISKGQGNFEALSEEKKPIFFMLRAKCQVVAKDIGCSLGDIILLFNGRKTKSRRGET